MAASNPVHDIAKRMGESKYKDMKPEELPWYLSEVDKLEPEAKELFEKYCNVPSDEVKAHIKQARDRAFKIYPYPCLGRYGFLDLSVSQSPQYAEVLQRVKDGDTYLDIGCCVGQDIRKLVFDGAPSENTYGSDLEKNFMDIGYDLFMDKSTLKTTFIAADIFNVDSDLKQLEGKIDIVHAASFFHLFNLEGQADACKRLVTLMKDKPGCLVIGRQIGNVDSGHRAGSLNTNYKRFRHNEESFAEMWKQVGEATGTKWEVDARLEAEDLHSKAEKLGVQVEFIPEGSRWIAFTVRRVA